ALWRELKPRLDLLPARLTRLTLRLDRDGRRHILAESSGEPWLDAERLRAALPQGDTVVCWWHPADGAARVVAGPATGFPATAFEQVHPEMGLVARRWAVEQLGDLRGGVVWDLYGGIGDTAVQLAARGAQVVSVDADETAIEWARGRDSERPIRFIAAKAEDVLPTLPDPNAVVVNPPRGGLHWNVTLRLTSQPVARVVYISCDPATLARDLHRLSVNYGLVAVRAFDLFPQTAHVETVAVLEAAGAHERGTRKSERGTLRRRTPAERPFTAVPRSAFPLPRLAWRRRDEILRHHRRSNLRRRGGRDPRPRGRGGARGESRGRPRHAAPTPPRGRRVVDAGRRPGGGPGAVGVGRSRRAGGGRGAGRAHPGDPGARRQATRPGRRPHRHGADARPRRPDRGGGRPARRSRHRLDRGGGDQNGKRTFRPGRLAAV